MLKRIILIFCSIIVIFGCNKNAKIEKQKAMEEIMKTDMDFCSMALSEGIGKAFIEYAAKDVVLMRNKRPPIIGLDSLTALFGNIHSKDLSWKPLIADVSESGDLGYTFGSSESIEKDSLGNEKKSYTVYITIWKKQADGKWKYVFDGGNPTNELFMLH